MTEQLSHHRRPKKRPAILDPNQPSVQFWREALGYINATGEVNEQLSPSYIMKSLNRAKRKTALRIRELESKLNRPHRYIKSLGAVQYARIG